MDSPLSLIAELTHRCPLKCTYCSNPLELAAREAELKTGEWVDVIHQAADLGVAQISFTGGEPCMRPDLPELVQAATSKGLYVNLITSGVGVSEKTLSQLVEAGAAHIQLSFQDTDAINAKQICGVDVLKKKKQMAELIRKQPVAFTVNLVIHRSNHSRLEEMIQMAVDAGAAKIEIAHVQFHGWALKNRAALMPTLEQVHESMRIIERARERLLGVVRIDSVLPDYYARTPKPCMGGWAKKMLLIDPAGFAAPCHSASTIVEFPRPSVKQNRLRAIWFESPLFNAFRGEDWMAGPCRSCEKKAMDFGGCRCQALALTGDAKQTDPVCFKSPNRKIVEDAILTSTVQTDQARHYRE